MKAGFCQVQKCVALLLVLLSVGYSTAKAQSTVKYDKIIGADISWLPQFEAEGKKYYDGGDQPQDAILILKKHGINYIRLRIFNNPRADSGYSKKGYCDLAGTLKMAKRIKAAGLGFLLDFHYSDNWADPQKQHIPSAWKNLTYTQLKDSVRAFTGNVLTALKQQGTLPDMVQVGNEINHGMMWPMANITHLDTLAGCLKAGIAGVKAVDKHAKIMLHIADGGQNAESRYFVDNMLKRGVQFDIIGESYYPEWHGTPDDLKSNLTDLSTRYKQDIIVVEYSEHKKEVSEIVFGLPENKGKGSFIWEPLNYHEAVFDKQGKANSFLEMYDYVAHKF